MTRRFAPHERRRSPPSTVDFAYLGDVDTDQVVLDAVAFDDRMAVPGCFDATPAYAGRRGLAAYRTRVRVEAGRQRLVFDGVQHWCRVFWNGEPIREHAGGFTRFWAETEAEAGEAEITVLVDNRFGEHSPLHMEHFDWYAYSGIAAASNSTASAQCASTASRSTRSRSPSGASKSASTTPPTRPARPRSRSNATAAPSLPKRSTSTPPAPSTGPSRSLGSHHGHLRTRDCPSSPSTSATMICASGSACARSRPRTAASPSTANRSGSSASTATRPTRSSATPARDAIRQRRPAAARPRRELRARQPLPALPRPVR